MDGRTKCKILKGIRQRIADVNGINYEPYPCSNDNNDCKGTCAQCEKELDWLDLQLKQKKSQGYRIYITPEDLEDYESQSNTTKRKSNALSLGVRERFK